MESLFADTSSELNAVCVERAYVAIEDYQASGSDELSFQRGAVLKVSQRSLDGWWRVRCARITIGVFIRFNVLVNHRSTLRFPV